MNARTTPLRARHAGFSFIEILVVMAIISVLVSMVVVVIPSVVRAGNRTQSIANARSLAGLMLDRRTNRVDGQWPPYSGKAFVLSVLATRQVDPRNPQNLEVFFSAGDVLYRLDGVERERYEEITAKALRAGGLALDALTSYAGRRNADRDYLITPDQEKLRTMVLCDDDDGPLHDPGGIVAGYTDGSARFLEWDDIGILPPEDADDPAPFLGDDATVDELRKVSR
jgi:prepilin-type N-terminal cleavage/methylation domain-containing protein